ncbi:1424_t:CDS:2, partial [Gigaspora rosea]
MNIRSSEYKLQEFGTSDTSRAPVHKLWYSKLVSPYVHNEKLENLIEKIKAPIGTASIQTLLEVGPFRRENLYPDIM